MSPLPTRMRDRWLSRTEPEQGNGTIYWHMLMHAYPQACDAANNAQGILSNFSGFHMTPHEWLHITTLVAGSTDHISAAQRSDMVCAAQDLLSGVAPTSVTLGRILYHPEAVVLAVEPVTALTPILHAAQEATKRIIGHSGWLNESEEFMPHVTVAYSTASQPASPIITALGKSIGEYRVVIDELTLVVQWGAERLWNWEPVGTARLGG